MRHILTKAQAIRYFAIALVAFAIITIYPLRLWHEDIISAGNEHPSGQVEVSGEVVAMQQFVPEYDHLDTIGIYLDGEHSNDELMLRVFDQNFAMLREEPFDLQNAVKQGIDGYYYAEVYINLDTTVGDPYYYTLEGKTGDFVIPIEMTANSGLTLNGYLQYAGEVKEAYNVITRYTYSQPLRKTISGIWIIVLGVLGAVIFFVTKRLEKRSKKLSELCTPQWILKIFGNPIAVIFGVVALVCIIPLHIFSIYIADIIVMSIGTILFVLTLLYLINRDYSTLEFDPVEYVIGNWQNLLQSLCIALALWCCINYMNGLFEVHHDIAWRRMAFYIGLSLIVTFTRKELINIYNAVLLVAGIITAKWYYNTNLADMADEYHVEAMRMTCYVIPVIFILAAYLIRCVVVVIYDTAKHNWGTDEQHFAIPRISWPYTVFTIIMAAAMVIRRNTRTWPIMMVVVFGVVAIRFVFWNNRRYFMNNIANGVIMHFLGCILYCLWHRPYSAYIYTRYPFVFHTVTETACYMALVMAVAIAKLFYKYNSTHKLKECAGEILLFGTAAAYTLFTMSRTGMLAVVAAGLVCWVAIISGRACRGEAPKIGYKFKNMIISAVIVVVSVIWCFPICFSLQKTIPAVVGEPKPMMIEVFAEDVLVSDDPSSEYFISFGRFTQTFLYKMFGIPESATQLDLYTIYGKTVVDKTMVIIHEDGEEDDEEGRIQNINTLLAPDTLTASADGKSYIASFKDGFVPPHEYSGDGEAPEEFYDEDYWFFNPETQDWEFGYWQLEENNQPEDISNGRMDIYRAYLEQMTPEGHEGMGAILNDGSEAAHAHDIYLQVAFDNGIIVGAIFILWVIATCIQALIVFIRRRDFDPVAAMGLAVSVTYAVAGVTEWISHPCNPVGMIFILVTIPLALMGREKK